MEVQSIVLRTASGYNVRDGLRSFTPEFYASRIVARICGVLGTDIL